MDEKFSGLKSISLLMRTALMVIAVLVVIFLGILLKNSRQVNNIGALPTVTPSISMTSTPAAQPSLNPTPSASAKSTAEPTPKASSSSSPEVSEPTILKIDGIYGANNWATNHTPRTVVVQTSKEWDDLWSYLDPQNLVTERPDPKLDSRTVIAVLSGSTGQGGNSVNLISAIDEGKKVVVTYLESIKGESCRSIQAFGELYKIGRIPKTTKPVEFIKQTEAANCN